MVFVDVRCYVLMVFVDVRCCGLLMLVKALCCALLVIIKALSCTLLVFIKAPCYTPLVLISVYRHFLVFYWCSLAFLGALSMLVDTPWCFIGVPQHSSLWSIGVH